MKIFKKLICLVMSFILVLSLSQGVFAEGSENTNKIRLGNFIKAGLYLQGPKYKSPEWYKEYAKNIGDYTKLIEYIKTHELYVTKEQAESITVMYTDDLLPIMYASEELSEFFKDFDGIESLKNLELIGEGYDADYGINAYAWDKSQINVYYKPLVEAFRKTNANELWPNLHFNSLRSYSPTFPYDKELRDYTMGNIKNKEDEIKLKIESSNLNEETKTKLKTELSEKVAEKAEAIKTMKAYDLSVQNFTSEFEKTAIKELEEIEKKIQAESDKIIEKFRKDNEEILSKDENSVDKSDEEKLNKALEDYNNLPHQYKEKLSTEKEKLDKMKDMLDYLKMKEANVKLTSHVEVRLGDYEAGITLNSSGKKPLILPGANYYTVEEIVNYNDMVPRKEYVLYAFLKEKQDDGSLKTIKVIEHTLYADESSGQDMVSIFSKFNDNKEYVIHDYIVPSEEVVSEESGLEGGISYRLAANDIEVEPEIAEKIIKSAKIKYVHETEEGDFSQSLKVKQSTINTKVKDGEKLADGKNILKVSDKVDTIKDVLTYTDLIPDTTYDVKGAIIDYDNYKKLSEDQKKKFDPFDDTISDEYKGCVVAKSDTQEINTNKETSGSLEVTFNNLKLEKNKKYVIVENVTSKNTLIIKPNLDSSEEENVNEEELANRYWSTDPIQHSISHFNMEDLNQTFMLAADEISIPVSKVWSDNSTDKEVTIKLLKKKAPIVIEPEIDDWKVEEVDIEMRSMPVFSSLSTLNNAEEVSDTSEENISEGYEFVVDEDGLPFTLTLNNSNGYSGTFKNLPKYEKDGKTLIEYKIHEVKVVGYTTSISGNQEEGFVVTNTKNKPEKLEVTFMNDNVEYAKVKVEKNNSINSDSLINESMPANPTKAEHTFKEWNTKDDGTGLVFTGDTVVNENMTVYAVYDKVEKPIVNPDPDPTPTPNPDPSPKPDPEPKPNPTPNVDIVPKKPVKDKTLPKTGDSSNIWIYSILLGLSGSMLIGVSTRRKRKN